MGIMVYSLMQDLYHQPYQKTEKVKPRLPSMGLAPMLELDSRPCPALFVRATKNTVMGEGVETSMTMVMTVMTLLVEPGLRKSPDHLPLDDPPSTELLR